MRDVPYFWHLFSSEQKLSRLLSSTVIGPSPTPPADVAPTREGVWEGETITFRHVKSWDHEPTEEEIQEAL